MTADVFQLQNPNLGTDDYLYHFGISVTDDLPEKYGDIKFVCTGGKDERMREFAEYMYKRLGRPDNSILDQLNRPKNIGAAAGRYSMYKVGPVLIFGHGIGQASLSVALNEVIKLLYYAKCKKSVKIIRIGSSGGLGVDPGTIVITDKPYDATLKQHYKYVNLGREISFPCYTTESLQKELLAVAEKLKISAIVGNTMASEGFFERAIICPTLVNRLHDDKVEITQEEIMLWQRRSFQIVGEYIKGRLQH